jgi:hypothetical protein
LVGKRALADALEQTMAGGLLELADVEAHGGWLKCRLSAAREKLP